MRHGGNSEGGTGTAPFEEGPIAAALNWERALSTTILGETVVGTARYGPVCLVVWEDGGREAPSYPILAQDPTCIIITKLMTGGEDAWRNPKTHDKGSS